MKARTKPPAYYNEGTLLTAMEKGNLGTVATRADIIDKLFNSFLMEKKDKDIRVTSKGRQLLGLVPEDLKKPELTADWEEKLLAISEGRLKKDVFISEIRGYTEEIVKEIAGGEGQFRHENLTNHLCPNCGKRMLSVQGKNSKMLVCQDRSCGYRESIAERLMPDARNATRRWKCTARAMRRLLYVLAVIRKSCLLFRTGGRKRGPVSASEIFSSI